MRLKGTMVMELTDAQTGEVETITEENMITKCGEQHPWHESHGGILF